MALPAAATLELRPRARLDIIDVNRLLAEQGSSVPSYPRALYCSYHTTAGYLEQSLCARMAYQPEAVARFVRSFQRLFPPEAPYLHDRMELREELSEEEREKEPANADSHLAFIGSGLKNCVTYLNPSRNPVFFIDLDGVHRSGARLRKTTVVGYNREDVVVRERVSIPVSHHAVDSINLKDPKVGFFRYVEDLIAQHRIETGRLDVALAPEERHAGLTVNEYETLLMKHDLREVLKDPFRFMVEKGKHILADPRAVPEKTRSYAAYDLIHMFNELMEALRISQSALERLIVRATGGAASRFLRLRKQVSFLVAPGVAEPPATIVQGRYQSPILVQWHQGDVTSRTLVVTLTRFS
ncbi:hypothetical protein EG19_03700 [Thermoanaerobaculum aquaticum]|uniref:Uncharacterized protein n=1 Tax=Thermoanaerobaculum aquaticum TaxID=1312852 RepID=A0A062Y3F1_9BACT|nr:hypothetical protein [Thermoanaerobaculum aquaticum]KDA54916.1 hypothetical protein EG19_03700 [Thermoanaerobaculum aquaticum]